MDRKYATGFQLKKGNRSSIVVAGDEEEKDVDVHAAFEEQIRIQKQSEEQIKEFNLEQETVEQMLQSQEYLKEEKVFVRQNSHRSNSM